MMMSQSQQGNAGGSTALSEILEKKKKKKSSKGFDNTKSIADAYAKDDGSGSIVKGASAGSKAGPWGMAIGAAVGALQGRHKRKQKHKAVQAAELSKRAAIHTDTAEKKNKAISNIMEGLRAALLG